MGEDSNGRDLATRAEAPEKLVVEEPPEPDYPRYRVEPRRRFSLSEVGPDETEHYRKKKDVARDLKAQPRRIRDLQERLYAENERGLLVVLQAMDTGGKDGTIKHVFEGINPQGCRVFWFKAPRRPTTTSSGTTTRASPRRARSAFFTARTTRTCSLSG